MCSCANVSKRLMASRNEPALRTWSQVSVVKLAAGIRQPMRSRSVGEGQLTAQRSDGGIDRFHKYALTVKLTTCISSCGRNGGSGGSHTSSQDFASSKIQPSSMTSAESFVTYTPCSSHVVATCITT